MLNVFQHPASFTLRNSAMKEPCVDILASGPLGTMSVGVTSNLIARLHQHRTGTAGSASKYGAIRLVRCEMFADMPTAIAREKQLKRGHRGWKINLIVAEKPDWQDLAPTLGSAPVPFHQPRPR